MRRYQDLRYPIVPWAYPSEVKDIPETCHHSQALEYLMTLDIDIPTILEEQEDDDKHDCIITEEGISIGFDHKISPGIPTNDDSTPPPLHMYSW